jgi:hypothetical protein
VVRSVTVRNWSYTVLGVRDDGFLELERLGVNSQIKSTLSPASVELVRRGSLIEVPAQDLSGSLEQQVQEALHSIQPPFEPKLSYSLIESSNLDQVWGVSQTTPDGKHKYLQHF